MPTLQANAAPLEPGSREAAQDRSPGWSEAEPWVPPRSPSPERGAGNPASNTENVGTSRSGGVHGQNRSGRRLRRPKQTRLERRPDRKPPKPGNIRKKTEIAAPISLKQKDLRATRRKWGTASRPRSPNSLVYNTIEMRELLAANSCALFQHPRKPHGIHSFNVYSTLRTPHKPPQQQALPSMVSSATTSPTRLAATDGRRCPGDLWQTPIWGSA